MRDEVDGLVGTTDQLEPVEHRIGHRLGVARRAVRPETFAGDDVLQAVAIHVDEIDRMDLGELHAVAVLARLFVDEDVLGELDLAVFLLRQLFIPGEAETMRRKAGDDVVPPVAVHIIGIHLRAAVGRGEGELVLLPNRISGQRRGLFPPTVFFQQVHLPVTVHITDAEAMGELMVFVVR